MTQTSGGGDRGHTTTRAAAATAAAAAHATAQRSAFTAGAAPDRSLQAVLRSKTQAAYFASITPHLDAAALVFAAPPLQQQPVLADTPGAHAAASPCSGQVRAAALAAMSTADLASAARGVAAQNFFRTCARRELGLEGGGSGNDEGSSRDSTDSDADSLSVASESDSAAKDGAGGAANAGGGAGALTGGAGAAAPKATPVQLAESALAVLADGTPRAMLELVRAMDALRDAQLVQSGGADAATPQRTQPRAAGDVALAGAAARFAQRLTIDVPMRLHAQGDRAPCAMVSIVARLHAQGGGVGGGPGARDRGRPGDAVTGPGARPDDLLLLRMTGGRELTDPRGTLGSIARVLDAARSLVTSVIGDAAARVRKGGGGGGIGGGGIGGTGSDDSDMDQPDAATADGGAVVVTCYANFDFRPRAVKAPNAYHLDHPSMIGVRRRKVIAAPSFRGSVIAFAGEHETADDLDRQFAQRHPFSRPLGLKLSELRALKDTLLQLALRDGVIDVATIAYTVCYAERLILRRLVNARSLPLVMATCLLIACKFHESVLAEAMRQRVRYVKRKCEELLGVAGHEMLRAEMHVLVALRFELHVHETYVTRHWVRLLGSANLVPAAYVGAARR